MLFNSLEFLLFFPVVTLIYFLLPHKFRWFHLLTASCVFYMAFIPVYILILFATIIIDYIAGIYIEDAVGKRRKQYLAISIVANIGVLAIFKYYNFFADNINTFLMPNGRSVDLLNMILPIGLSFHTFQAMSYTIEVYRGNHKAERHLGIYSLYVMFYPQLVAGPIERPQNLLYQFHKEQRFDYDNAVSGLRQMMWGMLKKVVIADRLAAFVQPVYSDIDHYSGIALFIASAFFAFQIYCDFSGYSDIAIGAARVMGFKLMTNFNNPYRARNISEFWKRWHISLSTWFKDYLYISLGGNKVSVPRMYFNLFFVFLVSGFWHGANWTFIIWGALNGFYLIVASLTKKHRWKINTAVGLAQIKWLDKVVDVVFTFILIVISWVFFRANNVHDGFSIISKFAGIPGEFLEILRTKKIAFLNLPGLYIIRNCIMLIAGMELLTYIAEKYKFTTDFNSKPALLRWAIYYTGPLIIYFLGVFEEVDFIYFQF